MGKQMTVDELPDLILPIEQVVLVWKQNSNHPSPSMILYLSAIPQPLSSHMPKCVMLEIPLEELDISPSISELNFWIPFLQTDSGNFQEVGLI